jgi:hypothetical protein
MKKRPPMILPIIAAIGVLVPDLAIEVGIDLGHPPVDPPTESVAV